MKILLVDSSYPINNRNQKILTSLRSKLGKDVQLSVCAWNRDGRPLFNNDTANFNIYDKKARYGSPLSKFFALFSYYSFVKLKNSEIKPDIIIASHWDMLTIVNLIKSKSQKIVYENLDIPTSSSLILRKIFHYIELLSLKNTSAIIFASRFFACKYKKYKGTKLIIENLPVKTLDSENRFYTYTSDKLKVSFIGTVRYFDVMKNLIDSVTQMEVEILFWGDGPDLDRLKEYSINNDSVHFFGKYEYKNISDIYSLSDLVWAVYPSQDYNVKFAISNKFYECLRFGRPGIFASNTMLGNLVRDKNIGYTVDPYNVMEIRQLFQYVIQNMGKYEELKFNLKMSDENRSWEDNENRLIGLFKNL